MDEKAVHLAHCYQGEYRNSCKYGDVNCPASPDASPDHFSIRMEDGEIFISLDGDEAFISYIEPIDGASVSSMTREQAVEMRNTLNVIISRLEKEPKND